MKFESSHFERQRPEFPEFQQRSGVIGFFQFLAGVFLWSILLLIFAIGLYSEWFRRNLVFVLQAIHPKKYFVPFWFAVLCSVLFFPLTLLLILGSTFVRIVKS